MRVSIAQFDVTCGAPQDNLAVVREMAGEAAARRSDVLMLPELWGSGYDLERADHYATGLDEGLFAEMARLASTHNLYIYGSLLSTVHGRPPTNTAALFAPDGRLVAEYSKLHLFRLMDEDRWLASGPQPVLAETPWGPVGLAICYDLRFPELFRHYALEGARAFWIAAQWPLARVDHWRTLLRARAIENQAFVIACNRVGETDGTPFGGHSAIIGPWGEIVAEAGTSPLLLTADIQVDAVEHVRRTIPVFEDRRPDVYGLASPQQIARSTP
ncbi:MAG: carbon-nitrogen family hydrolase [Ardenticatenia bacterium]|nr:carbon-nitrogen family hydrolase [Ardenticatenia bacterium]